MLIFDPLYRLSELDLSNNWLTELPSQLTDCNHLSLLNLTLNRFKKVVKASENLQIFFFSIPLVLSTNSKVTHWQLAGNFIENLMNIDLQYCIKVSSMT